MNDPHEARSDVMIDGYIVEIKRGAHSARDLGAALLRMSYVLVKQPDMKGLLVLVDSRMTKERLNSEITKMRLVMRGSIIDRIEVVRFNGESFEDIPIRLSEAALGELSSLILDEKLKVRTRDSFYSILQVLILLWLKGAMPVTRLHLMKITGMSYPTVAGALKKLSPFLGKTSDRSVEFEYFPRQEWNRMLAVSGHIRSTKRYAAPQGMSRPVEQLIDRLADLGTAEMGIGGVVGAAQIFPEIDIVGLPRLDLSIHCWRSKPDYGFIAKLDPALEPLKGIGRTADVVVHTINRKESFFTPGNEGLFWADPVECLMDLFEAGLSRQGDEFLGYLENRRFDSTW